MKLFLIQYPEGKLSVSYGVLAKINENNYDFIHKCSTAGGSSGSPILKLDSNKIIGIHKNGGITLKNNKGVFLNFPIKEFIEQNCSLKQSNKYNNNSNIEYNISQNNPELIMQNQAKRSICNIKFKEFSTGFLCMIPLNNGKNIPSLICSGTEFGVNENLINNQSIIKLSFDNDSITHEIKLTKDRMICYYKNNFQRITIIEIKDYDTLKSYNFLELDENAMNPKKFENFKGINAYMVKYCKNRGDLNLKSDISFGKIINIDINREGFIHQIDSGLGSLGAPILNLSTFKVFGMHQGFIKGSKEKLGNLLYFSVNEFIGKFISNQK